MTQAWIVRAGRDDKYEHEALEHGVIAMGWRRVGDLAEHDSQKAIKSLVDVAYAEFSARSRQVYGVQLFAFRCHIAVGDFVVLVRSNAPDVAVGTVTGDYVYRPDLPAHHVRPVRWARTDVRRAEIGTDLLTAPALTSIYKINRSDAQARLAVVVAGSADATPGDAPRVVADPRSPSATATAQDNLRCNLEYALSLATAGLHLQQLKVESFEVSDVFRAAWVQAVAALDHWVHQEIHERMLTLADQPPAAWPTKFQGFQLPVALVDQIAGRRLSLREAIDRHWIEVFGKITLQQPRDIQEGIAYVADARQLWVRIAKVLTERAADGLTYTSADVQERLREVVHRRNKIAHEYDEDPTNPPAKRAIDAASTTRAIEWIGQLTEAIGVVLDGTQ